MIGIVSLLLWTLILIVTLKYVVLILRADNRGEGGTLSLLRAGPARGRRAHAAALRARRRRRRALLRRRRDHPGDLGPLGGRGPRAGRPELRRLRPADHRGDPRSALLGAEPRHRAGLGLLRPDHRSSGSWSWPALGICSRRRPADDLHRASIPPNAVELPRQPRLRLAGGDGLGLSRGHRRRGALRRHGPFRPRSDPHRLVSLVFPALALNYLGQGSLVLAHPAAAANPFFLLAPEWGLLPLVLLATCATVIASQAVISGAYSLTQQAVQLGLLPRLEIRHTSESLVGQIYMPRVNWMLLRGGARPGDYLRELERAGERLRHRRHRRDGDRPRCSASWSSATSGAGRCSSPSSWSRRWR